MKYSNSRSIDIEFAPCFLRIVREIAEKIVWQDLRLFDFRHRNSLIFSKKMEALISQLAGVVLPLLRAADVVGFSSGIQSCQRWHQSLAMFMMMTMEALQPNVICYQALLRHLGKKRFVQEWWTLDVISDVWCAYIHIYIFIFMYIYIYVIFKIF